MLGNKDSWARKVGRVFSIRPRTQSKGTVWLERKQASQRFADAYVRPGGHVCLDGPTGVGKTSLVSTYLAQFEVRHVAVMATANMKWQDFCRLLISPSENGESSISGDAEIGIDKGLPSARFKISLGVKGRLSDEVELSNSLANSWTEYDVAQKLAQEDAALIVDDMERASEELMIRLGDVCKLLNQQFISDNSKVAFVGSGDVFKKLYKLNPALDERLTQTSLGAFKSIGESRLFMMRGFEALNLRHPWNSILPREQDQKEKCAEAIWEAANGLPKSLNQLGYSIAMRAAGRSGVSANDILDESKLMVETHWAQYGQDLAEVLDYLAEHEAAVDVVRCLYEQSISRIHKLSRIKSALASAPGCEISSKEVESVIDGLTQLDFLVRTGKSGELLFVRHPAAAHTLGVVMRNPEKFSQLHQARRGARKPVQLAFPLPELMDMTTEEPDSDA